MDYSKLRVHARIVARLKTCMRNRARAINHLQASSIFSERSEHARSCGGGLAEQTGLPSYETYQFQLKLRLPYERTIFVIMQSPTIRQTLAVRSFFDLLLRQSEAVFVCPSRLEQALSLSH